ncbi:hypothetical protein NLG97_g2358 [Lecanicillium saksenae]|uniref:Uncharacterized protein n=1 Tax=Lecanicillium saksenae TaxID=468837 RepID=A0ACC1R2K2_9HYPO|nr:hypothetical protein NLG97_g2358 [Lecanicillium saksenae]
MLRPATLRPLQRAAAQPAIRAASRRTLYSSRGSPKLTQEFDLNRLNSQRRDYERNRTAFLTAGAVAGVISFIYTAWKLKKAIDEKNAREGKPSGSVKFDAGPNVPTEQFKTEAGELRKVVLHDEDGHEVVPTGNSTVPLFPRTMDVSLPLDKKEQSPLAASISDSTRTQYNYSMFHVIFFLATTWVSLLLTISHEKGIEANSDFASVGRTYAASWIKIVSAWLCYGIYAWSMIAPVVLPERFDFS